MNASKNYINFLLSAYGAAHHAALSLVRRSPISSRHFGPPKGVVEDLRAWVSSYRERYPGVANRCWYKEVEGGTPNQVAPPRSLHPGALFVEVGAVRHPNPFVACLPKARVILRTGMVVSPDDQLIEQSCNWGKQFYPSDIEFNSLRRRLKPSFLHGPYITVLSRAWNNYYHWISECMVRLIMDESLGELPLLLPRALTAWHKESLDLLGVSPKRRCLLDDGCYEVDELYLPSFAGPVGSIAPSSYQKLRRLMCGQKAPRRGKRLYVARGQVSGRRVVNEVEIIDALRHEGFVSVEGQRLSVSEQRSLFCDAEIIVGVHGAGLANLVFAPDSATVIEVQDPYRVNSCYYQMAASLGHHYWYLFAENVAMNSGQPSVPGYDDLLVPIEPLLETVRQASLPNASTC